MSKCAGWTEPAWWVRQGVGSEDAAHDGGVRPNLPSPPWS